MGQNGLSRDDGQSADRGYRARPISAPEQFPEKRYFRIARVADTAIGVVALIGGFLAATSDRMPAGLQDS